jgi:hypothetical protein
MATARINNRQRNDEDSLSASFICYPRIQQDGWILPSNTECHFDSRTHPEGFERHPPTAS